MRDHRPPPPADMSWQHTTPGTLAPADAPPPASTSSRKPQPPLQEVLKGLDARELEGETLFDQLFGPLPAAKARPRKG